MGNTGSKGSATVPSAGLNILSPINLAGSNSLSLLGTQFAPLFPSFLTNNPLPNGFPWGSLGGAAAVPSRIERRTLWPSWLWPFNSPSSSSHGGGSSGIGSGTSTGSSGSGSGTNTGSSGTPSSSTVKGHCWDGTIVNPQNPQRRDVQMLLPGHYIVLQWNQDNPGVWPLHCHIAWHASAGFVWMVLENPAAIQKDMAIPGVVAQTCPNWDKWTSIAGDDVPQIGSGIKARMGSPMY
ncbi:hypothetical protein PG994_008440 [Apiospora phragmitis]|uniref:Plastocyanin-like domain-containing protein n=1 Tax=Apiospora phragmitis TaxID=2905665 RepID=A0ABR1UGE5_9PEZI